MDLGRDPRTSDPESGDRTGRKAGDRTSLRCEFDFDLVFDFDFKRGVHHVRPAQRANAGTFVPVCPV